MLKLIAALSRSSKLSKIHPNEKIVLAIFPIIIMGFARSPLPIIFNIVFFLVFHIKAKNNLKIAFKFTIEIAIFTSFSCIALIFDYGLDYIVIIILKSISAGLCLSFFSLTTPLDDVFYVVSKYNFLRDICDIAKSMERFIIVIEDEYNILYNSVKSRSGFDSFKLKIKNTGKIAALLFVNTMRRWKDIKDGINSRCYTGSMPYLTKTFNFSIYRFIAILGYNIVLAVNIFLLKI